MSPRFLLTNARPLHSAAIDVSLYRHRDMSTAVDPFSAGSDPFGFDSFSYNPQHSTASAAPTPALGAGQIDPMLSASPATGSSGGRVGSGGAGTRNGDSPRKEDEEKKPVV